VLDVIWHRRPKPATILVSSRAFISCRSTQFNLVRGKNPTDQVRGGYEQGSDH